ncbi:plasma kallikrein-like [Oppia nitens]|uniref:plasma kallikrein-like n=1 Tax=Oppia nitens TaxID=1686743 RepID=UPI0023DBA069|nr:plasma kallikrein-like [Oppia nitens]
MGAESVSPGQFPWVVSFQNNRTKQHFCSGTVLNGNWIITAAHCFLKHRKVDTFYIRTGSVFINKGDVDRAQTYYIHPMYNFSDPTGPNDLALVYIGSDEQKSYNKINNNKMLKKKRNHYNDICLPEKNIDNKHREIAYYSGFGRINHKGVRASSLMTSQMTLLPDRQCQSYITRHGMACLTSNTSHTCKGDSGSPLIQYVNNRAVLIGIHKGSTKMYGKCGKEISVTTRVSKFIDWIVDTIKNHQNIIN